jgi:hypothetical protein
MAPIGVPADRIPHRGRERSQSSWAGGTVVTGGNANGVSG